ncbi:MAG: UDP-2,3-diacylglucosamine diphosphatase LpxI [Desulfobacteraceae bacterium]|nr:UDP-2,3-diacylglucosamine diphosphatase LpxI [Desulfobacteraceae bacterium]
MASKIGIVAGGGQFPLLFAQAARREGRQVVVVAHRGESRPDLAAAADRLYWIKLGQLGKIISYFKKEKVGEAVFVGTITKTRIFRDIRPDWRGLSLWRRIRIRQDDAILRAIADELEKEGIRVRESTLYLKQLLFPRGVLTRREPAPDQIEDIRFGWKVARAIGALDIGQCVVVRDRTVLAVEAIEGTDAAVERGGRLAGERAVVVKVKKPIQDFRFDLPAIGLQTIATMQKVKAGVLAVETGQALLFDGEAVVREADRSGMVIVGIEEQADGSLVF